MVSIYAILVFYFIITLILVALLHKTGMVIGLLVSLGLWVFAGQNMVE